MAEASCFDFERSGGERLVPAESEDDALVAQALNELTMEEREKVYEEVGYIIRDLQFVRRDVY